MLIMTSNKTGLSPPLLPPTNNSRGFKEKRRYINAFIPVSLHAADAGCITPRTLQDMYFDDVARVSSLNSANPNLKKIKKENIESSRVT